MGTAGRAKVLTRCPACETHFRVTAEQLKARSGRVRCGECQRVFNAIDGLIEEPMAVIAPSISGSAQQDAPEPQPEAAMEVAGSSETGTAGIAIPPAPPPEIRPETTPEPEPEAPEELPAPPPEAEEASTPQAAEAAEADTDEPQADQADIATEPQADEPDWSETFPAPLPPPRRWPWVIGSLVALTAISLQAVLAFRVELAVLWPEARPALVALCAIAGCEVALPAKVSLVGIEASDLHPDTEHAGRLMLTTTLKNRAPFAQQFPHLELTLTDTADQAIARKILAPADYLPPQTSVADGMRPNADIAVAVGIDPGEITASGYRLYLFYP